MVNILFGKTITGMKISEDKQSLLFETDIGRFKSWVYGDCCSHSWIEHVELPVNGFPAKVLSVRYVDMPDLGNGDAECRRYYGFKIVTDKGDILIDYRNDSNGYYGGYIEFPEEGESYFNYEGIFGQNLPDEKWVEIVE